MKSKFFMKFGGVGKQELDVIAIIPYLLYIYKAKMSDQCTIYKGKTKLTNHTGYSYGISITPCFQLQFSHGGKDKDYGGIHPVHCECDDCIDKGIADVKEMLGIDL